MLPPEAASLQGAAQQLAVSLSDGQAIALLTYRDLIAKWNRAYNLTAVRDPRTMVVQHLLDSLAVIAPLRRHTKGQPIRCLDVGSGAGLPGAVVALVCPEVDVTCIDTVDKKVSFVRQAAIELGLKNLHAVHSAVERLESPAFDLITARAFATLADLVTLTRHLLAPDGAWLAMKGHEPTAEIAALPNEAVVFHVEPLQVPGLEAQRCLVWMRST